MRFSRKRRRMTGRRTRAKTKGRRSFKKRGVRAQRIGYRW